MQARAGFSFRADVSATYEHLSDEPGPVALSMQELYGVKSVTAP